jgi:hypothetical protein
MQKDFLEFIGELKEKQVDFVIVGGLALAYYGYPRYTGDLDVWILPSIDNAKKLYAAIETFIGTKAVSTPEEFIEEKYMISLGEEPVKIEIHHTLDGVTPDEIWSTKTGGTFGALDVYYIGKDTFIKNKRAVGRDQDLVDIKKIQD